MNSLLISFTPITAKPSTEGLVNRQTKNSKDQSSFENVIKTKQSDLKQESKVIGVKSNSISKNSKIKLKAIENQDLELVNEEIILGLIAEYLQMPVEQIQEKLQELEIQPIELLDQKQFMDFISEVYKESLEALLISEDEVKKITKLWDELEEMSTSVGNVRLEFGKQQNVVESNEQIAHSIEAATMQQIPAIEVIESLPQVKEIVSRGEELENKLVDATVESTSQTEILMGDNSTGLGLQIPIQTFNEAIGARMWQNQQKEQFFEHVEQSVDIRGQIVSKLEIISLAHRKEIQMELDPKELGRLSFKMIEENGVFTAQIRVDNEKTKELIIQNLTELKDALEEQGITVSKLEVDVREQSRQSQMNQERQKSTKRIEEIMAKHLGAIEEELQQESEPIRLESEVDIMV